MKYFVVYYETEDGTSYIYDFIQELEVRERAKALSWIELLEKDGPILPRPYADILEDGIHELRVKLSGKQVRVLYFFCYKNYIVLTHSFIKTSNKVPKSEIKLAKKYREDFLKRYDKKALEDLFNEDF